MSSDYGSFFNVHQLVEQFGQDITNDDYDGKYHFLIYSDGEYIYAWDPVRRTQGRVIGTNFTNVQYMVTDSEDSDNNYLFVADQLEDG